ncbi:MAG: tetratricopeptide repeat protein [Deltaproteobacteria bacterium]|nr:tetratricopeptide repeat protein [Deltaproteobacteria bacterium]MDQ3298572.1 tetratricopeptide repeat protein [Myxococcota bacterium]
MGDLLFFSVGPRRGLRRGTRATDWYEQGCVLEATDVPAAMAAYTRALAGSPELADAHNNLGRLHHDRGELAAAEGCYRVAICCTAEVALYWFNLGVVVEDQGRQAEAIAAYERAIELEPAIADAHFNLARLYEVRARRAGSIDELMLRRAVRHLVRYRDLAKTRSTGR